MTDENATPELRQAASLIVSLEPIGEVLHNTRGLPVSQESLARVFDILVQAGYSVEINGHDVRITRPSGSKPKSFEERVREAAESAIDLLNLWNSRLELAGKTPRLDKAQKRTLNSRAWMIGLLEFESTAGHAQINFMFETNGAGNDGVMILMHGVGAESRTILKPTKRWMLEQFDTEVADAAIEDIVRPIVPNLEV